MSSYDVCYKARFVCFLFVAGFDRLESGEALKLDRSQMGAEVRAEEYPAMPDPFARKRTQGPAKAILLLHARSCQLTVRTALTWEAIRRMFFSFCMLLHHGCLCAGGHAQHAADGSLEFILGVTLTLCVCRTYRRALAWISSKHERAAEVVKNCTGVRPTQKAGLVHAVGVSWENFGSSEEVYRVEWVSWPCDSHL